ncbi:MAG: HAMP domain-containing protein, partial [Desulfobacterales bacterium]|nr:HAMP domain-containing protein [Desulfobacterales bacterium]
MVASPFKSIHIKIIFWTLLPSFFVMGVLSVLSLVTIKNTALEVVQRRDVELAEMTGKRLAENLARYPLFLQTLAEGQSRSGQAPTSDDGGVARGRNWLHFFDGGIFFYDTRGAVTGFYPRETFYKAPQFPDAKGFRTLRKTLRPFYSDILTVKNRDMVLIAVPILGADNEFAGAVAGVCSLNYSTLGTTYTKVLEYKSGKASYAYLVDRKGRVLYHRQPSLMGEPATDREPVQRVIAGEIGTLVTRDITGEKVISSYAPVPGTGWGVITQGDWSLIQDLIRFYTRYSLLILWGGGVVFALVVSFFMQRLLEPVRDLTQGAAQIANGHFIEIPVKETGDEIEVLSRQFNSMARAMKASFGAIHGRIDELNRAQKALRQSEEKIRGIINSVNDVMLMVDDTGEILWINDKARRVMGDQADGAPYFKALYRLPSPPEDCIVSTCFATGVENDTEIQLWNQGKYQDFWLTANVVQRDKAGKVTRVVVVCRNLTEKKRRRAEV